MNSTPPICALLAPEPTKSLIAKFYTFSLLGFKPTLLSVDLFGHLLCFVGFYKESRKNRLYSFQCYEIAAKCLDALAALFSLFVLCFVGTPLSIGDGSVWYKSSYTLMYMSAKFGITAYDIATNIKLFVTIAMTLDRFFAMTKPMKYQNLNRFRWEFAALSLAGGMAILINSYGFYTNQVKKIENSEFYVIVQNVELVSSTTYRSLVFLRTGIFLMSLIISIGCNAKIIAVHKNRNKNVALIILGQDDPAKINARRETEKTLLTLTIFQSVQILNEFFIKILHSCLDTFLTGFVACEGRLFTTVRYVEVTLINSMDFYVMIFVNRQFRQMI